MKNAAEQESWQYYMPLETLKVTFNSFRLLVWRFAFTYFDGSDLRTMMTIMPYQAFHAQLTLAVLLLELFVFLILKYATYHSYTSRVFSSLSMNENGMIHFNRFALVCLSLSHSLTLPLAVLIAREKRTICVCQCEGVWLINMFYGVFSII